MQQLLEILEEMNANQEKAEVSMNARIKRTNNGKERNTKTEKDVASTDLEKGEK
jgi:hypothetical protein